jgi:hypothetical protein
MMFRTSIAFVLAVALSLARPAHADDDDPGMLPPPTAQPPAVAPPPATPPPVTPPPTAATSIKEEPPKPASSSTRLVLELKLPVQFTVGTGVASTGPISVAPLPELLIGLHTGRLTLELGFGLSRQATNFGTGSGQTALTEFVFSPVLAIDVFQPRDRKMALYLLGAPLFGAVTASGSVSGSTNAIYGFVAGFGVRLFVHRNLALGLESGFTGQYFHIPSGAGGSAGITSVYAALTAAFVGP